LLNSHFHPERVIRELNSISGVVKPHIQEHLDRWGYHEDRWATPQSVADWESNLDLMRHFATNRSQVVRNHLNTRFFMGGMYNLTVEDPYSDMGHIQVNTIALSPQTHWVWQQRNEWQGTYFKFQNLTLKAVPAAGYRFVSWSGDLNQSSDSLVIRNTKDIRIKALFAIATSDDKSDTTTPYNIFLLQNYPNPFNPSTMIRWEQNSSRQIKIDLFDISGRLIMNVVDSSYPIGQHSHNLHGGNLSAGVYILLMKSNDFWATQKIVLLK
jgi:hypothetical protein